MARASGRALQLHSGSRQIQAAKRIFVQFTAPNLQICHSLPGTRGPCTLGPLDFAQPSHHPSHPIDSLFHATPVGQPCPVY